MNNQRSGVLPGACDKNMCFLMAHEDVVSTGRSSPEQAPPKLPLTQTNPPYDSLYLPVARDRAR